MFTVIFVNKLISILICLLCCHFLVFLLFLDFHAIITVDLRHTEIEILNSQVNGKLLFSIPHTISVKLLSCSFILPDTFTVCLLYLFLIFFFLIFLLICAAAFELVRSTRYAFPGKLFFTWCMRCLESVWLEYAPHTHKHIYTVIYSYQHALSHTRIGWMPQRIAVSSQSAPGKSAFTPCMLLYVFVVVSTVHVQVYPEIVVRVYGEFAVELVVAELNCRLKWESAQIFECLESFYNWRRKLYFICCFALTVFYLSLLL